MRPLTPDEDRAWRALVRLLVLLPRTIDADLAERTDLSLTQYVVLMRLSEAPQQSLRMRDLADAASISPSRVTRVVQGMERDRLVERGTVPGDGRGSLATLTPAGLRRVRAAWPAHLDGVRSLVLDHIDPTDLPDFYRILRRLLDSVEGAPQNPSPCHVEGLPRRAEAARQPWA